MVPGVSCGAVVCPPHPCSAQQGTGPWGSQGLQPPVLQGAFSEWQCFCACQTLLLEESCRPWVGISARCWIPSGSSCGKHSRLEPLKPPRNAQASSESGLEGEVLLLQLFAAVFCLSLFPFIPPFSCHLMTRPRPLWVQEQGRCPRGAAVLGLWVCFFLPPPCAPARVRRCRNNRGHYSYHGDSDSGRDASFLTQTALFHLLCFSKPLSFCMRRQM